MRPPKPRDLIGRRFGRLTVVGGPFKPKPNDHYHWACVCACGEERLVRQDSLLYGRSKSCGCLKRFIVSEAMKAYHRTKTKRNRNESRSL